MKAIVDIGSHNLTCLEYVSSTYIVVIERKNDQLRNGIPMRNSLMTRGMSYRIDTHRCLVLGRE